MRNPWFVIVLHIVMLAAGNARAAEPVAPQGDLQAHLRGRYPAGIALLTRQLTERIDHLRPELRPTLDRLPPDNRLRAMVFVADFAQWRQHFEDLCRIAPDQDPVALRTELVAEGRTLLAASATPEALAWPAPLAEEACFFVGCQHRQFRYYFEDAPADAWTVDLGMGVTLLPPGLAQPGLTAFDDADRERLRQAVKRIDRQDLARELNRLDARVKRQIEIYRADPRPENGPFPSSETMSLESILTLTARDLPESLTFNLFLFEHGEELHRLMKAKGHPLYQPARPVKPASDERVRTPEEIERQAGHRPEDRTP